MATTSATSRPRAYDRPDGLFSIYLDGRKIGVASAVDQVWDEEAQEYVVDRWYPARDWHPVETLWTRPDVIDAAQADYTAAYELDGFA